MEIPNQNFYIEVAYAIPTSQTKAIAKSFEFKASYDEVTGNYKFGATKRRIK